MEQLKARRAEIQGLMRNYSAGNSEHLPILEELQQEEAQLNEQIRLAEQGEREQAQEAELQEIVLPYDFNDIFESHSANDMIIEIVREFQRKSNMKHNEEILASGEREFQLQRLNSELLTSLQTEKDKNYQLDLRVQDAEQKRDNAAHELGIAKDEIANLYEVCAEHGSTNAQLQREINSIQEENARLNEHIDDLRKQLANAPAPKGAIEIGGTSKLDELVAQAKTIKETNADKANRGLARWGLPPIQMPEPPQESQFREDSTPEFGDNELPLTEAPTVVGEQFRTEDIPTDAVQADAVDGEVAIAEDAGVVSRAEFEELREFVKKLNLHEDGSVTWNRDMTGWVEVA